MATPLPNPLRELHARQPDVEFQPYADVEVVSTFGQPEAEYAAIRKGCGLMDLPQRGVLELAGKDRLPFLNNLLTHQTWNKETKTGLQAGRGVYAFFLNLKGRIVADVNVLELGDRCLLEMDGRMVPGVRAAFDKYLFAEQVTMTDRTGPAGSHQIALHGPDAKALLDRAAAEPLAELAPLGSQAVSLFGTEAVVWRDDATASPGYHLVLPVGSAAGVWAGLLDRFGGPPAGSNQAARRELRPVGWAAYNAARVEAGRALFGIDFDESILPAETGQFDRAVSVTKGCYLGQEIVARMHARRQVAKQLAGIRMDGDALPLAGAKIYDPAGNEIGGVTSSTVSPVLSNAAVCLGLLKKPFFAEGTAVTVPAEGAMRPGKVVKTPFLPATRAV